MDTALGGGASVAGDRVRAEALPERLDTQAATTLAIIDGTLLLLAAGIAAAVTREPRGAAATALVLAATAFLSGRYHRSFAIRPKHETYASIAVATVALPFAIVACIVLQTSWIATALAFVLGTLGLCASAIQACRVRRKSGPLYVPYTHEVSRAGRVRARSLGLRIMLRVLDLTFGSLAAIAFAPVMACIVLLIAIDCGRPVFFAQQRVGRDDRDFTMWKFRTMRPASGSAWVAPGDDRITRSGAMLRRTSLDELPQLYNVLRGEMSLAGARPEMREYADAFEKQAINYPDRHILRPGITGWAQLHCPRNLQPSDMPAVLAHDLFFIQNASVHLYVLCLVQTAFEVFTHQAV